MLAPLGDCWAHSRAVGERARSIGRAFAPQDCAHLIAAAYLHDVGYAPQLRQTGFHAVDGARHLRSLGHERLARLVAHHSEARFEARLRGLDRELEEFPREPSMVADALTWCDMTVGSAGEAMTLHERTLDIACALRRRPRRNPLAPLVDVPPVAGALQDRPAPAPARPHPVAPG